jgi:hypothetical protein
MSKKIGVNDPCPCGSLKKYKKCCLKKDEQLENKYFQNDLNFNDIFNDEEYIKNVNQSIDNYIDEFLNFEDVDKYSTEEIFSKLEEFGVKIDEVIFVEYFKKYYSAEDISEKWFEDFEVTAKDLDEDFLWFSAWVLAKRFSEKYSLICDEHLGDLIEEGFEFYENKKYMKAYKVWIRSYEFVKMRIINEKIDSIEEFEEIFKINFSIKIFFDCFTNTLIQLGNKNEKYYQIRMEIIDEILKLLNKSSLNYIKDFKLKRALKK